MRRNTSKAALYESIMRKVSRVVKNALNESTNSIVASSRKGVSFIYNNQKYDLAIVDSGNVSHYAEDGIIYESYYWVIGNITFEAEYEIIDEEYRQFVKIYVHDSNDEIIDEID